MIHPPQQQRRLAIIDLQGTPAASTFYVPPRESHPERCEGSNPWWIAATTLISIVALYDLFERFRSHARSK